MLKDESAGRRHLYEKAEQREWLVRVDGRDPQLAIHAVLRHAVECETMCKAGGHLRQCVAYTTAHVGIAGGVLEV